LPCDQRKLCQFKPDAVWRHPKIATYVVRLPVNIYEFNVCGVQCQQPHSLPGGIVSVRFIKVTIRFNVVIVLARDYGRNVAVSSE